MNDSELLTAVREQRDRIPMTVPVEQVINRGRAVRARRRIASLAAGLVAAAGVAVAVTALLPGSHPARYQPGARLTAWTVVKQPNGNVAVTIRELYHPAGLQAKIRADGVPARVIFGAVRQHPPGCRAYPAGRAVLNKVFPKDPGAPLAAIVIHPSALPTGAGVYIDDYSNPYGYLGLQIGLVHASKQCTGS